MIRLSGVSFRYPASPFRLDVEELEVAAGERVACIGPSGTGKTTLVHLVAGILVPERGEVEVAGARIDGLAEKERRARRIARIGMVFQELELLDYLSALDNVLLPYLVSKELAAGSDARERARRLARETGIEHTLARRPARLSHGERQRVAICRALVTEPPLVLCDEPTGNLDPDAANAVLDLLFQSVAERGTTLLMVTHDHSLLARFDRTVDVRELVRGARAGSCPG